MLSEDWNLDKSRSTWVVDIVRGFGCKLAWIWRMMVGQNYVGVGYRQPGVIELTYKRETERDSWVTSCVLLLWVQHVQPYHHHQILGEKRKNHGCNMHHHHQFWGATLVGAKHKNHGCNIPVSWVQHERNHGCNMHKSDYWLNSQKKSIFYLMVTWYYFDSIDGSLKRNHAQLNHQME